MPQPPATPVHLRAVDHRLGIDTDQERALTALLPADEARRLEQFGDRARRTRFLIGRALLRTALTDSRPGTDTWDWTITTGPRGKPRVIPPDAGHEIGIAVSHAGPWTVVAVAPGVRDLGLDVARRSGDHGRLEIADEFFAPDEVRALRRLSTAARGAHFAQLWALKESYAKAGEISLNVALPAAAFTVRPGGDVRARFGQTLADEARRWRFGIGWVDPDHVYALALRSARRRPPAGDLRRCRTLPGSGDLSWLRTPVGRKR